MLPRYRNLANAIDHAKKLASGEVIISTFLYTKSVENIEDPEKMYNGANLNGLKKNMILFLSKHGYPSVPMQRKDASIVDAELSAILYGHLQENNCLPKNSEAADIKLWSFFNIALIPEIIQWRFKKDVIINIDRFVSIRRNYTGYLWLAAWLFQDIKNDDKWFILKRMSVDSIVQIIERPGVGYNKGE